MSINVNIAFVSIDRNNNKQQLILANGKGLIALSHF